MERHNATEKLAKNPEIIVPLPILRSMSIETKRHEGIETGGLVFGIRYQNRSINRMLALGVFNPNSPEDIVRDIASVLIGGPGCNRYQSWAFDAWNNIQNNLEEGKVADEIKGAEFGILGMWHSHPGGLPEFSSRDDATVNNILSQYPFEDTLFIITSQDTSKLQTYTGGFVHSDHNGQTLVNFYYRRKGDYSTTHLLQPYVVSSEIFPLLPEAPWYIGNRDFYKAEIQRLRDIGYKVTPLLSSPHNRLSPPTLWLKCENPHMPAQAFYLGTDNAFDQTGEVDFTTTYPGDESFYETGETIRLSLKEWELKSLAELVNFYSLFTIFNFYKK